MQSRHELEKSEESGSAEEDLNRRSSAARRGTGGGVSDISGLRSFKVAPLTHISAAHRTPSLSSGGLSSSTDNVSIAGSQS